MPPYWQRHVHKRNKTRIVSPFAQMRQLVNNNVLEAFGWLLGEFGVEADPALTGIAASPLRLHLLDDNAVHPNAQDRRPLCDQCRRCLPDLVSIPSGQYGIFPIEARIRPYAEDHFAS